MSLFENAADAITTIVGVAPIIVIAGCQLFDVKLPPDKQAALGTLSTAIISIYVGKKAGDYPMQTATEITAQASKVAQSLPTIELPQQPQASAEDARYRAHKAVQEARSKFGMDAPPEVQQWMRQNQQAFEQAVNGEPQTYSRFEGQGEWLN